MGIGLIFFPRWEGTASRLQSSLHQRPTAISNSQQGKLPVALKKRLHFCSLSVLLLLLLVWFLISVTPPPQLPKNKKGLNPDSVHGTLPLNMPRVYVVSLGSFSRCRSAGSASTHIFKGFQAQSQIALQKRETLCLPPSRG